MSPSSITSSFPSMSFPEHTENSSPVRQRHKTLKSPYLLHSPSSILLCQRVLVSRRYFSSLAINFLLPFVNGVMLGFGEIFAKNIVLEWWRPGSSATMTGVRGGQAFRDAEDVTYCVMRVSHLYRRSVPTVFFYQETDSMTIHR